MSRYATFFIIASTLAVSACSGVPIKPQNNPQYWQRISISDAAYMQGPKAQQILSRDIARCVVELRELERLGAIKNAIPANAMGRIYDPDHKSFDNINEWDTPERSGALLAEHTDYVDFYSCMLSNGWERVRSLSYEAIEAADSNYKQSNLNYKRQKQAETLGNLSRISASSNLND